MSGKYKPVYPRVAQLKTTELFQAHLEKEGIDMPFVNEVSSGLASVFGQSHVLRSGRKIGNAFCILPMEGWDGTTDGRPSELTKRRWKNFALSGAKLLWGCEAVAVRPEGRANPNQLMLNPETFPDFVSLVEMLQQTHLERFGDSSDLVIGLQLTHSGRFCKPNDKKKMEPRILYPHPVLNQKFGLGEDYPLMSDQEIEGIIEDYIKAAVLAQKAGFHFVDIKHCHGYLGHEFLSAYDREGKYGGSFENRTRFLKEIVEGIRKAAPGLEIGVRMSVFDWVPFQKGPEETGVPAISSGYRYAFGGGESGQDFELTESFAFLQVLKDLDIELFCTTAGSPYYNPHIQRPALFPPSDGYLPPEDPLHGVARQIQATAAIKKEFPEFYMVGSAYSYLQEWLPNVGESVLTQKMADSIGFGRMVLSYPDMPADILAGPELKRGKICRTFSDCTTAPRNGMISGCFPLDPFYKNMPEYDQLKELKSE
ncbi:2,4-dienoyl-CoA reductase-like NADH-dependent reductase (Old Yellow Enzyme family) [Algoriphagus boseongensis]|uniref:2,4-dienoyl-CoA reductase-like NADH-dependent reductase (Old Yellow Enzyme family) n=1 Tax=Algoriphagus boseongensis TaxID=1442587 RepID=A0A4R6T1N5_9BACT|nr:NADH:flavin oxidoreductase [Algoriphagus boseongensis]TDQ13678.1 2,4-dienoyl-CoA reductase-like NADH-dependent reductase (Old Yellow Enzyme family) [Algoriphagus boseongensis]